DAAPQTGTYMVRAIKLESSASGTYFDPSQGIFASVTATSPPPAPAPAILAYTRTGTLTWSTVSGRTYRVVSKTFITDADWAQLTGDIVAGGPTISVNVPTTGPQQWLRVLLLP